MKRLLAMAGLVGLGALLMTACPGGGTGNGSADAGPDAHNIDNPDPVIRVSGTATVHPNAAAWMGGAGLELPALEGLTLRIEEPLKAALGDEDAVFGAVTLDPSGAFSVDGVDTALVNVGLAATLVDEADAGTVVRSATAVYDVEVTGVRPQLDLTDARAYSFPTPFHDQLTDAVTAGTLLSLTGDAGAASLIAAGFILGKVVDAQGQPVGGAKVITDLGDPNARIFYPNDALTAVTSAATHAGGLFLYVHDGTDTPETFLLSVEGDPTYRRRSVAVVSGTALLLTLHPGEAPPQSP
jgi:hypothetical protein